MLQKPHKTGGFILLVHGLDSILCIVLTTLLPLRDNQKCYRFTPPVSNWRMFEGVSVDALCGFGAKKFNRCTEFIQIVLSCRWNESFPIGHSSVFAQGLGAVMVHFRGGRHISGRVAGHLVLV